MRSEYSGRYCVLRINVRNNQRRLSWSGGNRARILGNSGNVAYKHRSPQPRFGQHDRIITFNSIGHLDRFDASNRHAIPRAAGETRCVDIRVRSGAIPARTFQAVWGEHDPAQTLYPTQYGSDVHNNAKDDFGPVAGYADVDR